MESTSWIKTLDQQWLRPQTSMRAVQDRWRRRNYYIVSVERPHVFETGIGSMEMCGASSLWTNGLHMVYFIENCTTIMSFPSLVSETQWKDVQRSAKRRGCLLSNSQAEPGRELTQPSTCLSADACTETLSVN